MGEVTQTESNATAAYEGLLCPNCGYDLRGNSGERCSECGQVIDRAELGKSRFPWVERKRIGTLWAYWKTVWLVTIGSRRLRFEGAKVQALREARRFGYVTVFLVAGLFLTGFGWMATQSRGMSFLAVYPQEYWGKPGRSWSDDLVVPWAAGATRWGVLPVMLLVLGIYLCMGQRRMFRLEEASTARQRTAEAIAIYSVGPLAWWPVLAGLVLLFYLPTEYSIPIVRAALIVVFVIATLRISLAARNWWLALWIPLTGALCSGLVVLSVMLIEALEQYGRPPLRISAVAVVGFAALAVPAVRCGQWMVRVKRHGGEHLLLDVPHLLGRWLLGIVLLLGVVPFAIGLVWIVVDSFL